MTNSTFVSLKPREGSVRGRKRKFVFVSLTAILTCLAIGVILTCLYAYKALALRASIQQATSWEGESFIREDPQLGFVARENAFARQRRPLSFTIYTDDRGGRVDQAGCMAPKKADVLTVGCSFTWGHGVEDGETYAKVLKRRTGLEVYNVSMASYGTPAALLSMKRYADLQPQVVIYGFIVDHKRRSLCPTSPSICPFIRPVPYVGFDADDLPILHGPIGDTVLHDQYLREVVLDHPFGMTDVRWAMYIDYLRLCRRQSPPYLGVTDAKMLEQIQQSNRSCSEPDRVQRALNFLVAEMAAQARSMQAKLIVVYLPYSTLEPMPGDLVAAVEAANMPETMHLVDASPALRELVAEEGVDAAFLHDDGHPAPAGHARIAQEIEPLVRRLMQ